jgi:hypothetical protein
MKRIAICAAFLLGATAATALAQRGGGMMIGGGSTAAGDYLRGIGIESWGAGLYNLNTAQGYAITVDANIRGDQYLSSVAQFQRDRYQKLLDQHIAKQKENYEARLTQIRDHPEELDVFTGTALNAAFVQMGDPSISPSTRRTAKIPIPREMIRRIPFKLDQKGLMFSLQRLTARGKGKWPVAFQQNNYAPEIKAYEKAIDKALDEMIDGKVNNETITEYDQAVQALLVKLDGEFEGRMSDTRYGEARRRIREMEGVLNLMKARKAQDVMAGIDRYQGETVEDLREFMDKHNLRFANVNDENAEERELYVSLFASIQQMKELVVGTPSPREQNR